jgi:hypothetical protein
MSTATKTTNHDDIRRWVEERGGKPAIVADTEDNGREGGILRINFEEPGGEDDKGLREIGWDEFFKIFEDNDLALLVQDEGDSRFNKFVSRD